MREYYSTFDKALAVGLRPYSTSRRNAQELVEYFNCRVGKNGHESYEPLSNPLVYDSVPYTTDNLPPFNWPFPQFFQNARYNIAIIRDTEHMEDWIFSVDNDYKATFIHTFDWHTFGQTDVFDLADFEDYFLASNGKVLLFYDTVADRIRMTTEQSNTPLFKTACNFKGQAIIGNITSDWHSCDSSSIVWSKIGEANFIPSRQNEAGFRQMPQGGDVYRIRRLGDSIIIYGSRGITRMFPNQQTFGWKELSTAGICCPTAVGGDTTQHLYVDQNATLWRMVDDPEVFKPKRQELGYQEFLGQMDLDNIVITFNPSNNDFCISDGVYSFLMSPYGLSRTHQRVSAMWADQENFFGMFTDSLDISAKITTAPFDTGQRGSKTLFSIEAGISKGDRVHCAADWRMESLKDFRQTDWVELNPNGFAVLVITGTDLRACIKAEDYSDFHIDYLTARWKMTDLRNIRGVYAAPPRGQQ